MLKEQTFDIIIAGGGLSGLSLAYRAFKEGIWNDKQVLMLDTSFDKKNDKTWSFWEDKKGPFEEVVHKQWEHFSFYPNKGEHIPIDAGAYHYKSIQSIDFYNLVFPYLKTLPNVTFIETTINKIENKAPHASVSTPIGLFLASYIFNSLYIKPVLKKHHNYYLQHFKGYVIETDEYKGNPDEFHFMDYRTEQLDGVVFVYVLPFSKTKILVEYTLFSKQILADEMYDTQLKKYIKEVLHIENYTVTDVEFGVIPMTDFAFQRFDGNIIHIGSAGGDTRGSTGYTYQNVQKTVGKIIASFKEESHPFFEKKTINSKHLLYDKTLLNVLDEDKYKGHQIFTDLFKNTSASHVFKFLDGETTLLDDVKIMTSLRVFPFAKAFLRAILKK